MGLFDRFKKGSRAQPRDPRLPQWIADLGPSDWRARKGAAEAIGERGAAAQEAVPALEAAIADENGDVCLAASEALSKIRAASG